MCGKNYEANQTKPEELPYSKYTGLAVGDYTLVATLSLAAFLEGPVAS